MNQAVPLVMTFSASDPTCGAGLQADLLTVASMGAHPLAVLTGLTAQNTQGVQRFEACSESWLNAQIESLLADIEPPHALKAGVLGSEHAVKALVELTLKWPDVPLVLDPVMASGRGDALGLKSVFAVMKTDLFAHTTLLTPNWPEGKELTGKRSEKNVAAALLDTGCEGVLLKGEHQTGTHVINRLYLQSGERIEFPCTRLPGQYHGSGCTLASACAVGLARGLSMVDAVALALEYTWASLAHAMVVGKGQLIPDRMHLMQQLAKAPDGTCLAAVYP